MPDRKCLGMFDDLTNRSRDWNETRDMGFRVSFYFFAFFRCAPAAAAGFFLIDPLLLTAFLVAALGAGLVEPDKRSSTAAPAASGSVSSPFSALTICSLPAAIVFDTIRLSVPDFVAIFFP